jgi:BirA family transcriptional regulator, biotin operon repressor / biotin---[acetyl-CoA-carboxylase] ligase
VNQQKFPDDVRDTATSLLLATGSEWSRVELAAALLKSLDREYRDLVTMQGAHGSILRRFSDASSYIRGCEVRVEENGGFEGVTEGLDDRGFLLVRSGDRVRTVLSGTVRPLKA